MNNSIINSLPERFNLADYLISRNLNNPEKVAIISETDRYTYGNINSLVINHQQFLIDNKFSVDQRIVFILNDGVEFVALFLAAVSLGIIPVLVNPLLGSEAIKLAILESKPSAIILEESNTEDLQTFLKNAEISFHFSHQCSGLGAERKTVLRNKSDLAFIAYTSGSTGKPKGVMHAHYSPIVACVYYAEDFIKLTASDVIFSGPSLSFTYGLGVSLYMPMYCGATVVLVAKKDAFSLVQTINTLHPTVFFGVPSHYVSMLSIKKLCALSAKQLRLCVSAGERCPIALWDAWYESTGLKICEGLGTTESTHIFLSNSPDTPQPGSIGKTVPGYEVTLNENGQLTVAGEGLLLGYWDPKTEAQQSTTLPSISLNEIYSVDSQGCYRFIGRNDGLAKINGLWIDTTEIEEQALRLEEVQLAKAIITANKVKMGLNQIALFIQTSMAITSDLKKKIFQTLKQQLPKGKNPSLIILMPEIPLNSTGKVDLTRLRSHLEKEEKSYEMQSY